MKEVQFIMNLKEVMHGPGPMFASMPVKGRKQTQEKMPFKSAWKLSLVKAKGGRSSYLPSIWTDYLHNLKVAQNGYMEKWCFWFNGIQNFSA